MHTKPIVKLNRQSLYSFFSTAMLEKKRWNNGKLSSATQTRYFTQSITSNILTNAGNRPDSPSSFQWSDIVCCVTMLTLYQSTRLRTLRAGHNHKLMSSHMATMWKLSSFFSPVLQLKPLVFDEKIMHKCNSLFG